MRQARLVAYRDDHGTLRTYTLAHTDEQVRDARYDCALQKRIPLDRVTVMPATEGPMLCPPGLDLVDLPDA
jgi:hypothetical protein